MPSKLKKKWDSLDEGIQKIAKTLGAIAAIIGIIAGASAWVTTCIDGVLTEHIDAQTQTLENSVNFLLKKTDAHEAEAALTFKRLEILSLIDTDPTNVVEIKRLYKEYRDAGGNHYVGSVIVHWCQKYYQACDI